MSLTFDRGQSSGFEPARLQAALSFASSYVSTYLLVAVAACLWIAPTSLILYYVASVLASGVAIFRLVAIARSPWELRLTRLYTVAILGAYGLANLLFVIGSHGFNPVRDQIWYPYGLIFQQRGLSLALAMCLAAVAFLDLWAGLDQPIRLQGGINDLRGNGCTRLLVAGTALVVVAVGTGRAQSVNVTGANAAANLSIIGSLALILITGMIPLAGLALSARTDKGRLIPLACLLALVICLLFFDRRYVIYEALVTWLALGLTASRPNQKRRFNPVSLVLLGILAFVGVQFVLALRVAQAQMAYTTHSSPLGLLVAAIHVLTSGQTNASVSTTSGGEGNLVRPYILAYFGGLVSLRDPMLAGRELWYSLQLAVPSAIDPTKLQSLPVIVESITHPLYGIPVFDAPHTDLVSGYDEFGFAGVLVYPAAVAALYRLFYGLVCRLIKATEIRLFVWFSLVFWVLYIQHRLAEDFVEIRDIALVVVLAQIIIRLPEGRLSRRA